MFIVISHHRNDHLNYKANQHSLVGIPYMMVIFVNFTPSRVTWEGRLDEELSKAGQAIGMSLRDFLNWVHWHDGVGSTIHWLGPVLKEKEKLSWKGDASLGSLFSALHCGCAQLVQVPVSWTSPSEMVHTLQLWAGWTLSPYHGLTGVFYHSKKKWSWESIIKIATINVSSDVGNKELLHTVQGNLT